MRPSRFHRKEKEKKIHQLVRLAMLKKGKSKQRKEEENLSWPHNGRDDKNINDLGSAPKLFIQSFT